MSRFVLIAVCAAVLSCSGCNTVESEPDAPAEQFAREITRMNEIHGVDVFYGGALQYVFVRGPRADAIRMTGIGVEVHILTVQTESQGRFVFDLGKVSAMHVRTGWITLYF